MRESLKNHQIESGIKNVILKRRRYKVTGVYRVESSVKVKTEEGIEIVLTQYTISKEGELSPINE